MNRLMKVSFVSLLLGLSGCETLMTRQDVREAEQKQRVQDQVVTLQRTTADVNNRFSDIEDDLRRLNGRVEVVENRVAQSGKDREKLASNSEQLHADNARKLQILQEEIEKMHEQMNAMGAEMNAMKTAAANAAAAAQAEAAAPAAKKDAFDVAEDNFDKKEWRKAILNFQKFRDSNPKHKKFAEATYKIGISFQELGMKDEARTFFDEVVAKFPSSPEAKKAKTHLKSLKKS